MSYPLSISIHVWEDGTMRKVVQDLAIQLLKSAGWKPARVDCCLKECQGTYEIVEVFSLAVNDERVTALVSIDQMCQTVHENRRTNIHIPLKQ